MQGVPVAPRRVFGVALVSGRNAGDRTWVCRAHPGANGIRVESVDPLSELPGNSVDPDAAARNLVAKVLEAPRSAWGFDFAFGLASEGDLSEQDRHTGRERWLETLERVADADGPGALDGLPARRRRTDEERGLESPLSPSRAAATWLGFQGILRPLQAREEVVVLPFDPLPRAVDGMPPAMRARVASTYLLEVAPECVIESAGCDAPSLPDTEARARCLRALTTAGWVRPMARALRERTATEPGGVRAVAAAVAAWRGYREYDHVGLADTVEYSAEGHAYC